MGSIKIAASLPSVAPRNDTRVDEDIKKLLDVICEIIANEYVEVARRNKDVFSNGGEK